ncbi:helix-turn-helix transcriptional regulator [Kocuria tytonicola]|uniref:helix-turn-helix transcriptional regulator n=1 Tax=Kocuria tytonicola TaxID=2055946 RepID=UPI000EF87E82|nr:helix-turn-helix domain-containing protein [Kocuria tytonicola]
MITTPGAQADQLTMERDRLLFADEVANMLRRSPGALRYMVHAGTAPRSAKIAGRRMWRESDVNAWLDAQFAEADA